MMRVILLFEFLICTIIGQGKTEYIAWCGERPLQWSDFKGKYDSLSQNGAVSSTGVIIKSFENGGVYTFNAYAVFAPQYSWTRYPYNDFLLSHEQVHFNISEVVARKMRKTLKGKIITWEDFDKVWEETDFLKENLLKELNDSYDSETSYGQIRAAQIRWKEKIEEELRLLDDFKIDCTDRIVD